MDCSTSGFPDLHYLLLILACVGILDIFPGGSAVKNQPSVLERWVQSLGWEDTLEKEMATHSSILT